jgi:flagellar biosynthesis GTPase FlhF
MAPSKLKREPDATPPPRKGLGEFIDDPNTSESKASCFAQQAETSLIPDADWRDCKGESSFKQVQIKEMAAKNAHISLRNMLTTLRTHLSAFPPCQPRIERISESAASIERLSSNFLLLMTSTDEMLSQKKEYRVVVGLLGATGAGKTTLLK